ncbi:MAG: NAD(P)-dependent oxidoreductase, partial [Fimbriimonadaceae bacterium]
MKVIVTGGNGFVGQHTIRLLAEHGHEVRCLDVRTDRDSVKSPYLYVDLTDKHQVWHALEGYEAIVHLGEIPHLMGAMPPDRVFSHNTTAGTCVLQTAADLGFAKAVYASSCQVYGAWGDPVRRPDYLPIDERHDLHPRNAYAAGKVANEAYGRMIAESTPMAVAAMRFPYVYGRWGRMSVQWVRFMLESLEPRDGMATYVTATDLAEAIRAVLESDMRGFEAYNVAAAGILSGHPVREYLAAAFPDYPEIPESFGESPTPIDTSKLTARTGWRPKSDVVAEWKAEIAAAQA